MQRFALPPQASRPPGWSRRRLLRLLGVFTGGASLAGVGCRSAGQQTQTFIAKADSYSEDLESVVGAALAELGITNESISGRRVVLKPNLVESSRGAQHINTHPEVVRATAAVFKRLGAESVVVAEGAGHRRDTQLILEESGMAEVLLDDRIPFVDLNYDSPWRRPNEGSFTPLRNLVFPQTLRRADLIVSMPKLKLHHWVGVTLSMKNLFGTMPSSYYGWPKNVLHLLGIENSILDITTTLRPQLAIVDGIVGMEGDGPVVGEPRHAGVLVAGTLLPSVDATCSRIMGLKPERIGYLADAAANLGPIRKSAIAQRGETISSVATDFELLPDMIEAHRGLR